GMQLIEKRAPGVRVEWRQLTSGPVIRDAMIAGQIDIGSGGFPPFALAIDKGLNWKAVGALNEMPLFLNCARAGIRSLKDLKPDDRIALPAIGSVQHIILQMEAERNWAMRASSTARWWRCRRRTPPPPCSPDARSPATSPGRP